MLSTIAENWWMIPIGIAIVGGAIYVYRGRNPAIRWERYSEHIFTKSEIHNNGRFVRMPSFGNPMFRAISYRDLICKQLTIKYTQSMTNQVMTDVDTIVSTVETITRMIETLGFGKFTRDNGSLLWFRNKNEYAQILYKSADDAIDQLDEIFKRLVRITDEGVGETSESLKLKLQIHEQDFQEGKKSIVNTSSELTTFHL